MNLRVKRISRAVLLFVIISIFILGLVYLGLGYYYRDSFSYGTRINGVYCTGHTPDEVNALLNAKYEYDGLTVKTEDEGPGIVIRPSDIDFSYDFKEALRAYLNTQNSWMWPSNIISNKDRRLNPIVTFNIDKLNLILNEHELFTYNETPEVSIVSNNGSYELYDNMKHRPNSEAMRTAIYEALYDSQTELVFDDSFFLNYSYTDSQKRTIKEYETVSSMLGADITYVFGEDTIKLHDRDLAGFLLRDDNGELVINDKYAETGEGGMYVWCDDAIFAWADAMFDVYDTAGGVREFTTTKGDVIEVSGGTYGNKIDREKEKDFLKYAIRNKETVERVPEYIQTALYQGKDDIGPTYVEVNMTDQMLYYYVDGELKIETPVVTGNMLRNMSTPTGTNFVYYKQRNRTLIGPNYQTFVHYWMAVNGHIGIHDATWRDEFGGDIYMTQGSHGCINTPMDAVSELYELVEIGTPVVMYYTE